MINNNNYEIWFLDYLEDNLSKEQEYLLLEFLADNPRLKAELDEMSLICLNPEDVNYDAKNNLKKELSTSFDTTDMIIALHEEDLSSSERVSINEILEDNDVLQEESSLFQKSKLSATSSVYPDKDLLKNDHYTLDDVDTLILSYLDGTISESDQLWLNNHFSPSALKKQINAFSKVKLAADTSIHYPDKNSLKKHEKKIVFLPNLRFISGIAASLLVLVLAYQYVNIEQPSIPNDQTTIVDNHETNEKSIDPNHINKQIIALHKDRSNTEPQVPHTIDNIVPKSVATIDSKTGNTLISNQKKLVTAKHIQQVNIPNQISKQIITPNNPLTNNISRAIYASTHINKDHIHNPVSRINKVNRELIIVNKLSSRNIAEVRLDNPINIYYRPVKRLIPIHNQYLESPMRINTILDQAMASLEKDNESNNMKWNLGAFEVDVPAFLIVGVEAVINAKESYETGKKENRNIYSLSLKNLSFYHSSERN